MFKHGKIALSPGDNYMAPRWVWEPWHKELNFRIDAAASDANRLPPVVEWYTEQMDAFKRDWAAELAWLTSTGDRGAIWCNPPYSRAGGPLSRWVEKALLEANRGAVVCMLLPADTSTNWFSLLWNRAGGIWQPGVRGYFADTRIRFIDPRTNKQTAGTPTFGSLIAVLHPQGSCSRAASPGLGRAGLREEGGGGTPPEEGGGGTPPMV